MQFPSSKGLGLRPQSFELKRPKKPRLSRKLDELKMPQKPSWNKTNNQIQYHMDNQVMTTGSLRI